MRRKSMTKYHSSEAMARTHDPKTSWEAAESVDTSRLEKIVLSSIKAHGKIGATHDEVWSHLTKSHRHSTFREGSITPRYATLERKGLIIRNGDTRKGSAGRSQLVMYSVKKEE